MKIKNGLNEDRHKKYHFMRASCSLRTFLYTFRTLRKKMDYQASLKNLKSLNVSQCALSDKCFDKMMGDD